MNTPKELEGLPEAKLRFREMAVEANDFESDPQAVIDKFRGLMDTCLESGLAPHVQKAVRNAALATIRDSGWQGLDEEAAQQVPETTEPAPRTVNRIAASGYTLTDDARLVCPNGDRYGLRKLLGSIDRDSFAKGFFPSENHPEPNLPQLAKAYAGMITISANGIQPYGEGPVIPQDRVLALVEATLDQWKPGLGRMVMLMAAPLPDREKPAAKPAAPQPKAVSPAPAIQVPARAEAKETARPQPVILTGSREGADPWKDGALLDIKTVQTSFGTLAMTTGTGLPKRPRDHEKLKDPAKLAEYTLNRDAIGVCEVTVNGQKVLRGCAADGMGFQADSEKAAAYAVRHMTTAPDFYDGVATLDEGIAAQNFDPKAATCMSAFEVRKVGNGYRIKWAHGGDTNIVLIRNGQVLDSLPEHTVQAYIDEVEEALKAGHPVSRERIAQAEQFKKDIDPAQRPQTVLSSFSAKGGKGYFATDDTCEWEAEPGDVIAFVTDGVIDSRELDSVAWDVCKSAMYGKDASPAKRCRDLTDMAFLNMHRGAERSKPDNMAAGVLVLA